MENKKITEQEASYLFILYLMKKAHDSWPDLKNSLIQTFNDKIVYALDDESASYHLALGAIAQDLIALPNLFPKAQAERLNQLVIDQLTSQDGDFVLYEINKYKNAFEKCLSDLEKYGNPINVIPILLLYKWLGKNIDLLEVEINKKKTGYFDPLIVGFVTHFFITEFAGTWKRVILKNGVELVNADLQ